MPKLTPTQRSYVRKKTKVVELDPSEMAGELNIIPFLDIVVNLIIFLLATVAYLLPLAQLEANLPDYRSGVGGRSQDPESTLNLSLTIIEEGVIVTGSGAKLAPGCDGVATGRVVTVPSRQERDEGGNRITIYDWQGLTDCLAKVKGRFPDERQVIIGADPLVHYEHLIGAFDAVREKGAEELFPEVRLSGGVR